MAINFISYLNNVGKSITYAAVDKVKEINPSLEELIDNNKELTKELYSTIKDYKGTMHRAKEYAIKSDLYEAADVGFHAIIEDIRTGKFYNKERVEEMTDRAGGSMTNYDGMDDPFAEIDIDDDSSAFDWDKDDTEVKISDDTKLTVDSMDHVGSKVADSIAEVTVKSAQNISETNINIASKTLKHNEFMVSKLSSGMGAINGTIGELLNFNNNIQKPYIDQSITFFNDISTKHKETNDLLRQIIENQNRSIAPEQERKQKEVIDWNSIGSIPDLKEYGKLIKKNIADQTMGLGDMFNKENTGMGNILLSFVASPLSYIPKMIVNSIIPKTIENASKALNESITGIFGATMARLNNMANDEEGNFITKTLGKTFGLQSASRIKNTIDISGYSARAIAWDEQSKQALTRVIPDTLAKILAAQTQTAESLYDYNTGKYVNLSAIAEQYDPSKIIKDAANSALKEYMEPIRNIIASLEFNKDDPSSAQLLENIEEALDNMAVNMYRNDKVLTPEQVKSMMEKNKHMELQNLIGTYDDDTLNIIAGILSNLGAKDQKGNRIYKDFFTATKNANARIFDTKASERRKFEDLEKKSGGVLHNLYNGFDPNENFIKNNKGEFVRNKRGKLTTEQIDKYSLDVFNDTKYSSLAYQKSTIELLSDIKNTIGNFYGYIQSTNPYDEKLADNMRQKMYHDVGLKTDEEEFLNKYKYRLSQEDGVPLEEREELEKIIKALEANKYLSKGINKYDKILEERTKTKLEEINDKLNTRIQQFTDDYNTASYIFGEDDLYALPVLNTDDITQSSIKSIRDRVGEYKAKEKKRNKLLEDISNSGLNISNIYNRPISSGNNISYSGFNPIFGGSISSNTPSILSSIERRKDKVTKENERAEENNTIKKLEDHNRIVKNRIKDGLSSSNINNLLDEVYNNLNPDINDDSSTAEMKAIANKLNGIMLADAEYREFVRKRKEQKEKDEKGGAGKLFKELFKIKDEDQATTHFLSGLKELADKPSEFMVRMIHKVDERLYNVVFGDENDDKMSPKSFMNQLTNRLGYVFRDFSGFMRDEVFSPLKQTLFGEDGVLSTANKKVKEYFNIDTVKTGNSVKDFIFGKEGEDGKRHGGMFGDKFNFAKASMKDVYGALGDMLVEQPDGSLSIDMQKFKAKRDEYYDQDKNEDGSFSGFKISDIHDLIYKSDTDFLKDPEELSKKYIELGQVKGIISEDIDYAQDPDYIAIYNNYKNLYAGTLEDIDLNRLTLKSYISYKISKMGYESSQSVLDSIRTTIEKQQKIFEEKGKRQFGLLEYFDDAMNIKDISKKANDYYMLPTLLDNLNKGTMNQDDIDMMYDSFGLKHLSSIQQEKLGEYIKDIDDYNKTQANIKDTFNIERLQKSNILNRTNRIIKDIKENHVDKAMKLNNVAGAEEDYGLHSTKSTGDYDVFNTEKLNYARGGEVKKTGIIAASEGEIIIPAKYNPNFHGDKNIDSNLKKERSQIDKFLSSIGMKNNSFRIGQYGAGGSVHSNRDGTGEVSPIDIPDINDEQFKNSSGKQFIINTRERYLNRVTERRKNSYRKKNYNRLTDKQRSLIDSIGYGTENWDNLSEAEKILFEEGNFQELIEKISTSGNRIAEGMDIVADDIGDQESYQTQKEKLFGNMIDDLKEHIGEYLPSSLGGALIGGGVSLLTGAIGGPLAGAAVGAAADLAVHSKGIQDWLFGEEFIDADGNTKRKGNILSKDLSNNITKYLPDMAKGGVAGAITSILPFVPGGPVAGLFIGSGLGFAKNNETVMSKLFGTLGEDGNRNHDGLLPTDFVDKLKKLLPEAAIGAIGGAAGGAIFGGPFGLVGNMTIGAGISILSQTDKFQDMLFGTKNPTTGIREGGLFGAVKTGFVDPLINTGKSMKDRFIDWFKKDIAHPISSAIAPLAKQGGLFASGIIGGITGGINSVIQKELGTSFAGFGHLLKDITTKAVTVGTGTLNVLSRPAGKMISSPFRTIGRIGEHFKKQQVADGNADYLSAKQRLEYRQELKDNVEYKKYDSDVVDEKTGEILHRKGDIMLDGAGRPIKNGDRGFRFLHNTLGRGQLKRRGRHADKFEEFDKTLVGMDKHQLTSLRNSLEYLKDPKSGAQRLRNEAVDKINNTVHEKYGFSYRESQKLLKLLKDEGLESAKRYISKLGLDEQDERELLNMLTQEYSVYEAGNEINSKSKLFRYKLMNNMRSMGLKGMTDKNIDKHLNYVNQELRLKEDQDPIDKLNDKQEERHKRIVNLFEMVVDQLKILNGEETIQSISKKNAKKNKRISETKSSMFGLSEAIAGRTGLNQKFNFANSNAIWGKDYEMDNELDENNKIIWFMVNKNTGERIQVDSNGNPVNSEDKDKIPSNYRRNTIIKNLTYKTKRKIKTGISNALNKGNIERRNNHTTKKSNYIEKSYREEYYDLIDKYGEDHVLPLSEMKPDESWKDFFDRVWEELINTDAVDDKSIDKFGKKKKSLQNKFFINEIHKRGLHTSKARFGRRKYYTEDGSSIGLKEQYEHMKSLEDEYGMDGRGKVAGEEQDEMGKRMTVSDLFGNPIQLTKSRDGRWIKNPADSDNKLATLTHDKLLGLGDKVGGFLGNIGKDIKDGFAHLFNVDTERDGWLKTLLKVGGGILGTLTAVSAMPAAEALWNDSIKPGIKEFWQINILPKIEDFLEPIKPTIAKAAVGIDMAIRSIPSAIDNLAEKVRGFIRGDLPQIWGEKILPFYENGINWALSKVDVVVENGINLALKALPAVISGAIKGGTKFLTKDIFTLFGGLGRRDSDGIFSSLTPLATAKSHTQIFKDTKNNLGKFTGFSDFASTLMGDSVYNYATPKDNINQNTLADWYMNGDTKSGYPVNRMDSYEIPSSNNNPFEGYNNVSVTDSGTLESNYEALSNYSESVASSGYKDPTGSNPAYKANNEVVKQQTKQEKSQGIIGKVKNKVKNVITPSSEATLTKTNSNAQNNTYIYDKMKSSNQYNNLLGNSMSLAQSKNATAQIEMANTPYNNLNISNINNGSTAATQYMDDNGYNYYETSRTFGSGSSAGISLYNCAVDDKTGLVYSSSGKFIPNAFYDPKDQKITDVPTKAAKKMYPNIQSTHDEKLLSEIEAGNLSYEDIMGDSYVKELDPYYDPQREREIGWGITEGNLRDAGENIREMLGNENSIGHRFIGNDWNTGLKRVLVTGNSGLAGKMFKGLANKIPQSKGLIKGTISKGLKGTLGGAGKLTDLAEKFSLRGLATKGNYANAALNQLKTKGATNAVSDLANSIQDLYPKLSKNTQRLTNEGRKLWNKNVKNTVKGIQGVANGFDSKAAQKMVNIAESKEGQRFLENSLKESDGFISKITNKIKDFFAKLIQNNEYKKVLKALGKQGLDPESVSKGLQQGSDDIVKAVEKILSKESAKSAGKGIFKKIGGKIAAILPGVNILFAVKDFVNGYKEASTFLGVTDDQMKTIDMPEILLRTLVGTAYALDNWVLLGLIPIETIIDLFINILLPVFGFDTSSIHEARELSSQELEKFKIQTGDYDATIGDLNKDNNPGFFTKLWNNITGKDTKSKKKMSSGEADSIIESRKAAQNLDAVKAGLYSYNSTGIKASPSNSVSSYTTGVMAKINANKSAKGSGISLPSFNTKVDITPSYSKYISAKGSQLYPINNTRYTGGNSIVPKYDSSVNHMINNWNKSSSTLYVGKGSGIEESPSIVDIQLPSYSNINPINNIGSSINLDHSYTSLGNISDIASAIPDIKISAKGSGLKDKKPNSTLVKIYRGKAAEQKKSIELNSNRGADVVSESARIIIYVETGGDISKMEVDTNNKYSIGAACWNDSRAASLLKSIIKKDSSSSKKILGDRLFKAINSNSGFAATTYSASELKKIQQILASDQSREVQCELLKKDITGYINTIKKKWKNPKVIIFLTTFIHQYGAGGLSKLSKIAGGENISLDAFFKQFMELSPYKNYKSRYDAAYKFASQSSCTSNATNNVSNDSIMAGLGLSTVTEKVLANASSKVGALKSGINLVSDLVSNFSKAFLAMFGVYDGDEELNSSNDGTTSSGGDFVEGSNGSITQNSDSIVSLNDQALTEEDKSIVVEKMEDVNYTLLERLDYLRQLYYADESLAREAFCNSELFKFLLNSSYFIKFIKIGKYNGKFNSIEEAANSGIGKYHNSTELAKLSTKIDNFRQVLPNSNPDAHNIYFTTIDSAVPEKLEIKDTKIQKIVDNIEDIAINVFNEFKGIANNQYGMESPENLRTVMVGFINAYITSDDKAKKLKFIKTTLKCNTSFYNKLKKNYKNREKTIKFLYKYIEEGSLDRDYNEGLFLSEKDRLYRDLDISLSALNDTDASLEQKESAWNTSTGIMAELLGLPKSDVSLTYGNVKANNTKFFDNNSPNILEKTPDIDKGFVSPTRRSNYFKVAPAKASQFKGLSKLAKQINRKKNKSIKEDINVILDQYPNVHDFDSLFNRNNTVDLFNSWNDTNTRGASLPEAYMKNVLARDSSRIITNANNISGFYSSKELASNVNNIIKDLSSDQFRSANVYNPYTYKRLSKLKNLSNIDASPLGSKYKDLMQNFVTEYLYKGDNGEISADDQQLLNTLFNVKTTDGKSNILPDDAINYHSQYGIDNFIDYYKLYLEDKSRIDNNYNYKLLGNNIDMISKYLPTSHKDIKIEGKDVDYDNYVYATALYEAFTNEINKYNSDEFNEQKTISEKDQKKLTNAFEAYKNFETRKVALQRQAFNDKLKNWNSTAGYNISYKDLLPDDEAVKKYFDQYVTSNTTAESQQSYDSETTTVGNEEIYDNGSATIGTLYLAQKDTSMDPEHPGKIITPLLNKFLSKNDKYDPNKLIPEVTAPDVTQVVDNNTNQEQTTTSNNTTSQNTTNINNNSTPALSPNSTGDPLLDMANAGKGSKTLNKLLAAKGGDNFISQLDYSNMKFSDGESMAESGCGPAVAAMAINGLSGGATMMDTARIADKYKNSGGTDANYFSDVFNRAGAKTTYYEGSEANSGSVKSLKAGQQVVLLGQDKSNRTKEKSPFGPGNHYVLAKGMENGKIAVNDPEQHGTKIYDKNILNNTKLGIAVSAKGSGYSGGKSDLFPTYDLNDREIKGLANIVGHEQPKGAGQYAEASLMANLTDITGNKTKSDLIAKATSGWFKDGKARYNNPSAATDSAIQAVKDVIIDGYRTLPRYVDEHDCYSDIRSATNDGKAISIRNRKSYIPHKTRVENKMNSTYTFYEFPDGINGGSDPFGYTTTLGAKYRSKWGDKHYAVGGESANSNGPIEGNVIGTDTSTYSSVENGTEQSKKNLTGVTKYISDLNDTFKDMTKAIYGNTSQYTASTMSYDGELPSTGEFGQDVVNCAGQYIDKLRYVYGGTSLTNGADCSGFVLRIYEKFGIHLPRTSQAQSKYDKGIRVNNEDSLDLGDLVFFGDPVHHVGIYSGNGKYIHSPRTGEKVKESLLSGRKDFSHGIRISEPAKYQKSVAAGSDIIDNYLEGKGSGIKKEISNAKVNSNINEEKGSLASNIKALNILTNGIKKNNSKPVKSTKNIRLNKKNVSVLDAVDHHTYGKIKEKKIVIGVPTDKDILSNNKNSTKNNISINKNNDRIIGNSKPSNKSEYNTINYNKVYKDRISGSHNAKVNPNINNTNNTEKNKVYNNANNYSSSTTVLEQNNNIIINLLKTMVTLLADISTNSQNTKNILKVLNKIYELKNNKSISSSKEKSSSEKKSSKKKKTGKGSLIENDIIESATNNMSSQIMNSAQTVMNNHSKDEYNDMDVLLQDLLKVLSD